MCHFVSGKISGGYYGIYFSFEAAVFRRAVKDAVSSVVIVHNHPSNETDPSPEDTHITMTLKKAGEILDITLLDHIIIGKSNTHFSFSNEGML